MFDDLDVSSLSSLFLPVEPWVALRLPGGPAELEELAEAVLDGLQAQATVEEPGQETACQLWKGII